MIAKTDGGKLEAIYSQSGFVVIRQAHIPLVGIDCALFVGMIDGWGRNKVVVQNDGWLYHTMEQIEAETGLGKKQQRRVRNKLVEIGWLEESKQFADRWDHRLSYRLDYDKIAADVITFYDLTNEPKGKNDGSQTAPSVVPAGHLHDGSQTAPSYKHVNTQKKETNTAVSTKTVSPDNPVNSENSRTVKINLGNADKRSSDGTRHRKQAAEFDAAFDDFWQRYPRQEGRADALAAWRRIDIDKLPAASAGLEDHLRYWKKMKTERQYIPLAANWLKGSRWNDQLSNASVGQEQPIDPNDYVLDGGVLEGD